MSGTTIIAQDFTPLTDMQEYDSIFIHRYQIAQTSSKYDTHYFYTISKNYIVKKNKSSFTPNLVAAYLPLLSASVKAMDCSIVLIQKNNYKLRVDMFNIYHWRVEF